VEGERERRRGRKHRGEPEVETPAWPVSSYGAMVSRKTEVEPPWRDETREWEKFLVY
jgi:hypothetical protein